MATRHSIIEPFPDHIDREAFGHWLSGFVDGEGCFFLGIQKQSSRADLPKVYDYYRTSFSIALRDDDSEILKLIQSFFQCGGVQLQNKPSRRSNPALLYSICTPEPLVKVIIPHFERHPLRAKKRKDFLLWRQAVEIAYRVRNRPKCGVGKTGKGTQSRWTINDRDQFVFLHDQLRSQRTYGSLERDEIVALAEIPERQKRLF